MVKISEVVIISLDKDVDTWAIEGEIIFDDNLNTTFEVTYIVEFDELEDLILTYDVYDLDMSNLKDLILEQSQDFEF